MVSKPGWFDVMPPPTRDMRWWRPSRYGITTVLLAVVTMALAGCSLSSSTASPSQSDPPTYAAQDYTKARTLYYEGEYTAAIPIFLRAITKNGMYVNAYSGLGDCYEALGSFDEAIAEYDKAIQIDPMNYGLYISRAGAEFSNGSSGAADGDLGTALRLAPPQAPAYKSIGDTFANYADPADAVKAYSMAIALVPSNPSLYEARATAYLAMLDATRAYEDYQQAIKVAPFTAVRATIYADLASVYSQQGDSRSATEAIATAIQLLPNTARFYVASGNIHRDAGSFTLALKLYDHALRLVSKGPDAEAAHEGKGDTLVKMDQIKAAISEYRQALRMAAKNDTTTRSTLNGKIKAARSGQS